MLAKKIIIITVLFITILTYITIAKPSPTHAENYKTNIKTVLYQQDKRKNIPTTTTTSQAESTLKQISWMDYTKWPDWQLWKCTMRVETGSRWNYVSPGGKFRGAFGIYRGTWQSRYNVPWIKKSYPLAETAAPWVQIIAEIGTAHV